MKKITLILSSLTLLSATTIGIAAEGQGGIAGTVAVSMGTGAFIETTSSAVAIGKTTAYTNGVGAAVGTKAYAAGTGGALDVDKDSAMMVGITLETTANVETAQKNTLGKDTVALNGFDNTAKIEAK